MALGILDTAAVIKAARAHFDQVYTINFNGTDFIVPTDEGKWKAVQDEQGNIDFTKADAAPSPLPEPEGCPACGMG